MADAMIKRAIAYKLLGPVGYHLFAAFKAATR